MATSGLKRDAGGRSARQDRANPSAASIYKAANDAIIPVKQREVELKTDIESVCAKKAKGGDASFAIAYALLKIAESLSGTSKLPSSPKVKPGHEKKAEPKIPPVPPEDRPMTIDQFCHGHNISRATYYNLAAAGHGPRLMAIGAKPLITKDAAADWRRRMETGEAATLGNQYPGGKK